MGVIVGTLNAAARHRARRRYATIDRRLSRPRPSQESGADYSRSVRDVNAKSPATSGENPRATVGENGPSTLGGARCTLPGAGLEDVGRLEVVDRGAELVVVGGRPRLL